MWAPLALGVVDPRPGYGTAESFPLSLFLDPFSDQILGRGTIQRIGTFSWSRSTLSAKAYQS